MLPIRPMLLTLCATAVACAGPRAAQRPAREPVLARVNGDEITAKEMKAEFGQSHEGHSKFLVAGESEAREFLGKLIDKHLLVQEAGRMGLPERADVRAEVVELEAAQAARHLLEVEVEAPAKASEADVQAVYDGATELVDARELRADSREDAERALARIRAGEDFDAVAREVSTAPSRVYGGLVKGIGWGAKTPEWEGVAFATTTGETSAVFETRQGWELVRVEERRPVTKGPLPAVASKIRTTLEARRKVDLDRRLREALFAKYQVELAEPVPPDVLVRAASAGDAAKRDPDADRALASWAGGRLTLADLAALVNAKGLAALPPERYRRNFRELATSSAYARLVRQEAAARGYARVPAVAEAVAARRDKLALDMLLVDYVVKDVTVTEEDARKFYDARPEAFATQEEREVAHVEVETLEAAKEVKALLASGKPFEEVVRSHSRNEKTKAVGGSLGLVARSDCPPEFEVVFSLAQGATTEPLAGKGGFHVIQVRAIVPPRPRPYEAVKDEALASLRRKRKNDALAAWTTRLRAASKVEIDRDALAEFVKASAKEAEALGGGGKPLPPDHGMSSLGGGHGGAMPAPPPHGGATPGASPHGGGAPE